MKRYLFASLALALAVGFSSFKAVGVSKRQTSSWYSYTGAQTIAARKVNTNYTKVTAEPTCIGSGNECAVQMNQTSTNPDFTNTTFDSNGFPSGNVGSHTDFKANDQKN